MRRLSTMKPLSRARSISMATRTTVTTSTTSTTTIDPVGDRRGIQVRLYKPRLNA